MGSLNEAPLRAGQGHSRDDPGGNIALAVGFNPFARAEVNEHTWALRFSLGTPQRSSIPRARATSLR